MGELKTRVKTCDSVDKKLYEELNKLSKETYIPRSKLLDKAITLLLKEYEEKLSK